MALLNVLGWTIGPVHETGWLIPLGRKEGSMPAALSQGSYVSAQALRLGVWNVRTTAASLRADGVSVSEDSTPIHQAEGGAHRRLCTVTTFSRCALGFSHPLQIELQCHDLSLIRVSGQGRSIDIGQCVQPSLRQLCSRSTH